MQVTCLFLVPLFVLVLTIHSCLFLFWVLTAIPFGFDNIHLSVLFLGTGFCLTFTQFFFKARAGPKNTECWGEKPFAR